MAVGAGLLAAGLRDSSMNREKVERIEVYYYDCSGNRRQRTGKETVFGMAKAAMAAAEISVSSSLRFTLFSGLVASLLAHRKSSVRYPMDTYRSRCNAVRRDCCRHRRRNCYGHCIVCTFDKLSTLRCQGLPTANAYRSALRVDKGLLLVICQTFLAISYLGDDA